MADPHDSELQLAGRHCLVVERAESGDALRLIAPDGSVPITIEITPAGVTLRLTSPRIALEAAGSLSLSADELTLEGRRGLQLVSGQDLAIRAAGDLHSHAQAHVVRAEQGGVDIKASDDVRLSGERVMVNCDETVDRYFRDPAVTASGAPPLKSSK